MTTVAHGSIAGLEGFFAGLAHPYVIPQHVLVLLALALFCGLRERSELFILLPTYAGALLFGLAGSFFVVGEIPGELLSVPCMLVGVLAAVRGDMGLPRALGGVLVASCGIVIGVDSGNPEASLWMRLQGAAGTWFGAGLGVTIAAGWLVQATRPWQRIAARIVASWIAAAAFLYLAFLISGGADAS